MPKDDKPRIAVVDDYPKVAKTMGIYIKRMGCEAKVYSDPEKCLQDLRENGFDIVVTDIRMPQMDGMELLKEIRKCSPETEVIVVSAHAEKKDAIEALKLGAYDFFEKPVDEADLQATIKRTLNYNQLLRQRDALAERLSAVTEQEAEKWGIKAFIGNSPAIKEVLRKIRLLQKSKKTNVLVLGESGTGKELVARAIHFGSERADGPFIAVNCSAIPDDLAESILFGHTKGSFTGATADRKGQFELADGGTLFLDEIGDMPALVQTKLLRVLEDGIVTPVGSAKGANVDVRVVSATNTNLQEKTSDGSFRSDLYHRLAAYIVSLPPLRNRPGDVPALTKHFVAMLASEMGIPTPDIAKGFLDEVAKNPFPGNVRELRNMIEHALIESAGEELQPQHLPTHSASQLGVPAPQASATSVTAESFPFNLKDAEKLLIQRAMDHAQGNVAEAARLLGISRARIYRVLD